MPKVSQPGDTPSTWASLAIVVIRGRIRLSSMSLTALLVSPANWDSFVLVSPWANRAFWRRVGSRK